MTFVRLVNNVHSLVPKSMTTWVEAHVMRYDHIPDETAVRFCVTVCLVADSQESKDWIKVECETVEAAWDAFSAAWRKVDRVALNVGPARVEEVEEGVTV